MGQVLATPPEYAIEADDFVGTAERGDEDKLFNELLTASGMYLNAKRSSDGMTALAAAIAAQRISLATILLRDYDGVDVNKGDADGRTPLMYAAAGGDAALVALLLERGAKVSATDSDNWTALHHAAAGGEAPALQELLELGAASQLDVRDRAGQTALHVAVYAEAPAAFRVLLAAGADADLRDDEGETALAYARGADAETEFHTLYAMHMERRLDAQREGDALLAAEGDKNV
uniref:Ankyrin repeat domain-containing protein n=2 Tax=Phaeomonas parva TaxID=124430 RepID=A0A7S1UHH1_9STRA|mmetsp:Transcript_5653/g.15807  ORF Transcript_5653/g.15807 Transcript_5653/m.15807 type:complete len:233 (+) Transcript_5653:114-812(+)|eukprot:CAMPEP_0118851832 /NCGR_PEP_ID=MMETSP1163-20130328/1116_1 /TAXON_ID=124430 /ORGANISM="Phaeomonas parva, Strain CCMP2877" /LENGTH=232 /DNA_ID=CAMNT_0006784221 /DNA_START=132 /DNA_END=830 /DNA_ORIENTATION=+